MIDKTMDDQSKGMILKKVAVRMEFELVGDV